MIDPNEPQAPIENGDNLPLPVDLVAAQNIRSFYTKPNYGFNEGDIASFNDLTSHVQNPEQDRARFFNNQFLAQHTGKDASEIAASSDSWQNAYAKQNWGKDAVTPKEFFDHKKADYELDDSLFKHASDAALLGTPPAQAYGEWQTANEAHPSLNTPLFADSHRAYDAAFKRTEAVVAPYRSEILGALAEADSPMSAAERLAKLPKDVQPAALQMMAALAQANAGKGGEGLAEGTAGHLIRGAKGVVNALGTGPERIGLFHAQDVLSLDNVSVPENVGTDPKAVASFFQNQGMTGDAQSSMSGLLTGYTKLSPERISAAREQVDQGLSTMRMAQQIKEMDEGIINPLVAKNFAQTAAYGLADFSPWIALGAAAPTATLPVLTASLKEDQYQNFLRQNPGMDERTADALSTASAIPSALAMEFGSVAVMKGVPTLAATMPSLARWLNQPVLTASAGLVKTAQDTAIHSLGGFVGMKASEAMPTIVQGLASALSEDVPEVKWDERIAEFKKIQTNGEMLVPVVLMSLISAGHASFQQVGHFKEMASNADALRAVGGFDESQVNKITLAASKGDLQGAQDLMREGFKATGLDQKELGAQQQVLAKNYADLMEQRKAGIEHLQNTGAAPIFQANEDGSASLTFKDGTKASYPDRQSATDALYNHIEQQKVNLLSSVREHGARMLASVPAGEEYALNYHPENRTNINVENDAAEKAVQKATADGLDEAGIEAARVAAIEKVKASIQERADIGKRLGEEDKNNQAGYDQTKALVDATAQDSDSRDVAYQILGANRSELNGEVMRHTLDFYNGHSVLTSAEEFAERAASRMVADPKQRAWLHNALREIEARSQALGAPLELLGAKDDAQVTDADLKEGWSHLVASEFINQAGTDSRLKAGAKDVAAIQAHIARVRQAIDESKASPAMVATAHFFDSFMKRAEVLKQLADSGQLPDDVHGMLAKSLGLDEQHLHEQSAIKEAEKLKQEMAAKGLELSGEDAPFSMVDAKVIQGYLELNDIPLEKQEGAKKAISKAQKASSKPYSLSLPETRGVDRGIINSARERQADAYRRLVLGDTEGTRKNIAEGVPMSSLMGQFIGREIPNFDIRGAVIDTPKDLALHILAHRTPYFESLKVIVLDDNSQVIHSQIVHVGSLNEAVASPQNILGIVDAAKMLNPDVPVGGFMISHNHPSGDPSPSDADRRVTKLLESASQMLNIPFVDHVITNGKTYFSFRESLLMVGNGEFTENGKLRLSEIKPSHKFGDLADFEAIPMDERKKLSQPDHSKSIIDTLRTTDPNQIHALHLDTRLNLIGVTRHELETNKVNSVSQILDNTRKMGAYGFIVSFPENVSNENAGSYISRLRDGAKLLETKFLDASTKEMHSRVEFGLMEDSKPFAQAESYSLAPHNLDSSFAGIYDAFKRSPDLRRNIGLEVARKLSARLNGTDGSEGLHDLVAASRSRSDLQKESGVRQALRERELVDEGMSKLTPETMAAFHSDSAIADARKQPVIENLIRPDANAIAGVKGRMMHPSRAELTLKGEYEDAPEGLPPWFWGGNLKPDQAAQELFEQGLIPDAYPSTMWAAVESAFKTANANKADIRKAQDAVKGVERTAKTQARDESKAWFDKAVKDQPSNKQKLLGWLRTLDALTSALPPEVRAKVGGYTKLASLTTDEARLKEIVRRSEKMQVELEKYLQNEFRGQIDDLLDKASSEKNGAGVRISKKFTAEGQHYFDEAKRVSDMSPTELSAHQEKLENDLDTLSQGNVDPDLQDRLLQEIGIASVYGNLDSKDAEGLANAHAELQKAYEEERGIRQSKDTARKNYLKSIADNAIEKLGNLRKIEAVDLHNAKTKRKKGAATLTNAFNSLVDGTLSTTHDILSRVLGVDAEATKEFGDIQQRRANHKAKEIEIELTKSWEDHLTKLYGGGVTARYRWISKLAALRQTEEKTGVFVQSGRKIETKPVDIERAREVVASGDGSKYGLDSVAVKQLKEQLAALDSENAERTKQNDLADIRNKMLSDGEEPESKKRLRSPKSLEVKNELNKGTPVEHHLTQFEGLKALMYWEQKRTRALMENEGWGEESIAQLKKFLKPETYTFLPWIRSAYDRGYNHANPVNERMFNMTMARNKDYTPISTAHGENEAEGSALDALVAPVGLSFGATIERVPHNATLRIPDAVDEVFQHYAKLSHWVANAEKIRDMQSVLLRPEVVKAIELAHGDSAVRSIRSRIEDETGEGQRKAAGYEWIRRLGSSFQKMRTYKALAFNIGTPMKHVTNVLKVAADEQIPTSSLALGYGKLISGELHRNGSIDRVMQSETIRNRMEAGTTPDQRVASGFGSNAHGQFEQLMTDGMKGIRYADAKSNGWGAAIAYDYYNNVAKSDLKMQPAIADAWAMDKVDQLVYHTAVPEDIATRTGLQNNKWQNLVFMGMFKTPAVKWASMEVHAVLRAFDSASKGEWNKSWRATRTALVTHFAVGAMEATVMGLYRYAFVKHDAEEAWSPEHYGEAMLLGPLTGIVGVSEIAQETIWKMLGIRHKPNNGEGSALIEALQRAMRGEAATGKDKAKATAELAADTVGLFSPATGVLPAVALRIYTYFANLLGADK
jgi:DNA repair protein RadC